MHESDVYSLLFFQKNTFYSNLFFIDKYKLKIYEKKTEFIMDFKVINYLFTPCLLIHSEYFLAFFVCSSKVAANS
jgi:hypothetical protein